MDLSKLSEYAAKGGTPVHAGRVLQLDGDFPCYYAADLDKSVENNFKEFCSIVQNYKELVGAESVNVFVTLGLKSGRMEMATVQPYQDKRGDAHDPELKERVHAIRALVAAYKGDAFVPMPCYYREADDALVTSQVARIKECGIQSSVMMSGDKDLWMVEGYFAEPKTGQLELTMGYGHTDYREVGNVKPKLVGRGTSWFWHQMIMGDKADNIKGLPMLSGKLAERYIPKKKPDPKRKPLAAGEAKAVAMLKGVTRDIEAYNRVMEAYQEHYGKTAVEMFLESAYLLWMQREDNPYDFLNWLEDNLQIKLSFSPRQIAAIQRYTELKEIQKDALLNSD